MEDPAAVAAREEAKKEMEDKLKWVLAAAGIGFVGYTVWQFLHESSKVARARQRKREPWEMT
jgi:hypothetical protein